MEQEILVYVGTYTEPILFGTGELYHGRGGGIHIMRVSLADGTMREALPPVTAKNPSFLCLHPNHRFLYAVNELKLHEGKESGSVSAFAVDPQSGGLTFLNLEPTRGTDPCYVTTDADGRHVLVANYSSGSVSIYPVLADGRLGEASDFVQHEGGSAHPSRQSGPHAHTIVFDRSGSTAFVVDLGLDRVVGYRYDSRSGRISPRAGAGLVSSPGSGPRHIVFSPDDDYAYVVNELASTVSCCAYDGRTGSLAEFQTISTLPAGYSEESSGAAILMHPTGRFLYASNRGHDSIAVLRRDPRTGRVEAAGHVDTLGSIPRDFAIDPGGSLMLVANQMSNNIVPFRIDAGSGLPEPIGRPAEVGSPVCIKFAG